MIKIGALVSGGGTNLQAIIDNIECGNINGEIVTVVSSNPNAYALIRANRHNIDSICIRKSHYLNLEQYDNALVSHFKQMEVDLIIMAGFMVILGQPLIRAYPNKIMNIHPSLIPAFCGKGFYGLKVHEEVIAKGVKITGATVHFVDEGCDNGPIILQKAVDVSDDDAPEVLQKRVMEQAEWIIYPEAIKLYAENKLKVVNNKVYIKGRD